MSRCLARLVDDKVRGKFKDGHHFHIEVRCTKLTKDTQSLCEKCSSRPREEPKNHPSALHGLIGQDIPAWSHLFGSAWYLSKVGKYGTPSEEEMVRAKKAVEDNASLPEGSTATTPTPPKAVTKPRKFKVAASASAVVAPPSDPIVPAHVPLPVPVPVVQAPKAKRKAKTILIPPSAQSILDVKAVESKEPILKISDDDVLIITVRKIEHNGRSYFLAGSKNKLYSVGKDGQPHEYIGRLNRQLDTIDADFPDSDQEF